MHISNTHSPDDLQDMGQYFRGLLVVMAADNHLHEAEQAQVRQFGLSCGFSESFIDEHIKNVLTNKHLPSVPPRFHSIDTAKRFLLEAARVATCDGELHPLERKWLVDAAEINDLDESLLDEIFRSTENR